jgi:hypothetical protein
MSPARVAAVAVALGALAALAGCGDDDSDGGSAGPTGPEDQAGPVANEDHWHAAFGVYVCDEFLPPLPEFENAEGIHTHGDGVVHIHPFTAEADGEDATLRVFLDGADVGLSDDELTVDGETYAAGDDSCGDGAGEIAVVRWADVAKDGAEPERVDPDDARFLADGEGYVVAFVAEGTDIPEPESAGRLAELGAVDGGGTVDTTSPSTTGASDDPPVATDDRDLPDGFYPVALTEPAPCRTAGMRPDPEGTNCYRLPDEPAAGADIIESAEASVDPASGGWRVDIVFTEDGIGAFNEVAAICAQFGATCPYGQLALLVGGEIVTAPTIQQPSFERDQVVVSGDFTRDEAEDLAEALAG